MTGGKRLDQFLRLRIICGSEAEDKLLGYSWVSFVFQWKKQIDFFR